MILVILGAGASYDSVDFLSPPSKMLNLSQRLVESLKWNRPPLADELFDARDSFLEAARAFPLVQSLAPGLRSRPEGVSLEQALTELWDQRAGDEERHRQFLALRFYIQKVVAECEARWSSESKGQSNFRALVEDLRYELETRCDDAVSFVTFNYDSILEQSLAAGLRVTEPGRERAFIGGVDGLTTGERYKVFKLHGSVNWARVVHRGLAEYQSLVGMAPGISYSDASCGFVDVAPVPFNIHQHNGVTVVPAIAAPIAKKDTFECPESHVSALEEELPRTRRVIVIGWKGGEEGFLELFRKHVKPSLRGLVICEDERSAKETIKAMGRDDTAYFQAAPAGFSAAVKDRTLANFLRDSRYQ